MAEIVSNEIMKSYGKKYKFGQPTEILCMTIQNISLKKTKQNKTRNSNNYRKVINQPAYFQSLTTNFVQLLNVENQNISYYFVFRWCIGRKY